MLMGCAFYCWLVFVFRFILTANAGPGDQWWVPLLFNIGLKAVGSSHGASWCGRVTEAPRHDERENSLGFGLACLPGVAVIQCYGYWIYDTLMGRLLKLYKPNYYFLTIYNPNYSKKGSAFVLLFYHWTLFLYFLN